MAWWVFRLGFRRMGVNWGLALLLVIVVLYLNLGMSLRGIWHGIIFLWLLGTKIGLHRGWNCLPLS